MEASDLMRFAEVTISSIATLLLVMVGVLSWRTATKATEATKTAAAAARETAEHNARANMIQYQQMTLNIMVMIMEAQRELFDLWRSSGQLDEQIHSGFAPEECEPSRSEMLERLIRFNKSHGPALSFALAGDERSKDMVLGMTGYLEEAVRASVSMWQLESFWGRYLDGDERELGPGLRLPKAFHKAGEVVSRVRAKHDARLNAVIMGLGDQIVDSAGGNVA